VDNGGGTIFECVSFEIVPWVLAGSACACKRGVYWVMCIEVYGCLLCEKFLADVLGVGEEGTID
jgi:hypothetical protein